MTLSDEVLVDYFQAAGGVDMEEGLSQADVLRVVCCILASQPPAVRRTLEGSRKGALTLTHMKGGAAVVRDAFDSYDADFSGFLKKEELSSLVLDLGFSSRKNAGVSEFDSFLEHAFQAADADGDQQISFHEFVAWQNNYIDVLDGARTFHGGVQRGRQERDRETAERARMFPSASAPDIVGTESQRIRRARRSSAQWEGLPPPLSRPGTSAADPLPAA